LLDKATGTAHFEVKQATALKIHQQLQNNLPGYLVPKLVKEQAGKASKTLLIQFL
jgi:L-lysine 2,3-aminomutase